MFDPTFGSSSPFWASFLDEDGFALPPVPEALLETNDAINDTSANDPASDEATQPGMSPDAPAFFPMKLKAANRANMQQANAACWAASTSNASTNSTGNSASTDNLPHRMSFEQLPNINLNAATVAQPQQSSRDSDQSSTNMYQFFQLSDSSSCSEATSTETDIESVMHKKNCSDQNKSETADDESESTSERKSTSERNSTSEERNSTSERRSTSELKSTSERKRNYEQDFSFQRERERYRRRERQRHRAYERERQRERAYERELDRDMIRSISSEFLQGLRRTNITCQLSFDVQTPRTLEKSKAQATQTDLNDGWVGPPIQDFAKHISGQVSAEYLGTLRNLIIRCDDLLKPLFAGKFSEVSPIQMAKYTSVILNTKPLHPSIFLPNNAARPWRSQCGLHPHCNTITKALADTGTQTDKNSFSFSPLEHLPKHDLGGTLYVPEPNAKPNPFGAIGSNRPGSFVSAPTYEPPTYVPLAALPPPTPPAPPTSPTPPKPSPPTKPPMVQRVQYHIMPSPKQLLYVYGYKWQIGDYPEHFSEQNFPDNGNPSNNCGYNLLSILNKNLPPGSKLPLGFQSNKQTASNLTQANLDLIAEPERAESVMSDDETSSTNSIITVINAKQYAPESTTPTNSNVSSNDSYSSSTGSSTNSITTVTNAKQYAPESTTPINSNVSSNVSYSSSTGSSSNTAAGNKWQIGDYPDHFSEQNFSDNGNPSNNYGYNLLSMLNKNLSPGSKIPFGFQSNKQTANLDLIAEPERAESVMSDDETSSTNSVTTVINAKQYAPESTTPINSNVSSNVSYSSSKGSSSNTAAGNKWQIGDYSEHFSEQNFPENGNPSKNYSYNLLSMLNKNLSPGSKIPFGFQSNKQTASNLAQDNLDLIAEPDRAESVMIDDETSSSNSIVTVINAKQYAPESTAPTNSDYPEHLSEQNFPDNGNPSNNCGYNLLSMLNKNLSPGSKIPLPFKNNKQSASNLTKANLDLIAEPERAESDMSDDETSSSNSIVTVINAKQYAPESTTPTNSNVSSNDSYSSSTGSSGNTAAGKPSPYSTYSSFQPNKLKEQSTPFTSYFTCNPPNLFLNPPTTCMDNKAAGDASANSNDLNTNVSNSTKESLENLGTDQLEGANVAMHDNNQNMVLTKTQTFPDSTVNEPTENIYLTQSLEDFTNTISSMPGTIDLDCPDPVNIIAESLWVRPPGNLPSLSVPMRFTNFSTTFSSDSDEF